MIESALLIDFDSQIALLFEYRPIVTIIHYARYEWGQIKQLSESSYHKAKQLRFYQAHVIVDRTDFPMKLN